MHAVLSSVLLTLALMGCAGVPSSGGSGGGPNQITREQLQETGLEYVSAWEIIERFHPQWLQRRGTYSFPRVVVNGLPYGGLDSLRNMLGSDIEEIHYLTAGDATTRFGTGYTSGAILVVTRRGDSL